jgi:Tfp pilus assembly protein PilO
MIDWRRVLQEKRRLVLPLVVAAVVNVGVYLLVVYPLTGRTASVEARAQAATVSLARASNEFRAAEATRAGRTRVDTQLTRFYGGVLPRDLTSARRLTHLWLARVAEEANLDAGRRTFAAKQEKDSALEELSGAMVLTGDYRDVRRFLHTVETSPEFVIIRQVSLSQNERANALTLTLQLATFYRAQSAGQP